MSAIQELIVQLNKTKETTERKSLTDQILQLVKTQDLIWAAFCPATKHYFLAKDENQITAYLFSDQDYYQAFIDEMRKKHMILKEIENKAEHRTFLFAELYRCGVTRVVIDNEQEPVSIPLARLIPVPDYTSLPLVQRPVLNPTVTGKILCLMQDVRFNRADGNSELDVFQEIYHSAFFLPIHGQTETEPEKPGIYHSPDDNKDLLMIFTDLYSLKQANPQEYEKARIVRFGDFEKILEENKDLFGLIINPGSGAAMLLDRQLLDIAGKYASGAIDNVPVTTLNQDSGKIIVTKPEIWPQDLADQIAVVLEQKDLVNAVYLRTIRRDEEIRRHFLIVLDWNGKSTEEEKKALEIELSQAVMPYARGLNLEYIDYQNPLGKEWAGSGEPFWKRPGLVETPPPAEKKEEKKKGLFGFFKK